MAHALLHWVGALAEPVIGLAHTKLAGGGLAPAVAAASAALRDGLLNEQEQQMQRNAEASEGGGGGGSLKTEAIGVAWKAFAASSVAAQVQRPPYRSARASARSCSNPFRPILR